MTDTPRGPLTSPGYALHLAALAWRRELGARLRPHGLTPTQFDALASLSHLARSGRAPTQQQLADFSGLDRMMLSKVLVGLEARDLVRRTPDPDDARLKRPALTASGRALVDIATAIARSVDADLFAGVDSVEVLREQLRRVRVGARADG